jgi:opacity protein-like surface antigen
VAGSIVVACALGVSTPAGADSLTVSGESSTILRMGRTDFAESKNLFPLYEYLRLSVASRDKKGGAVSLQLGGWLRGDLADRSHPDGRTDQDLQYGFLSYQGARNNFTLNAGRQLVTEGVATERLDGLYLAGDLGAGFAASAFVGAPVRSEPSYRADDLIYGGRIGHGMPKYYSIGISALQSTAGSSRYREEAGVDLWLHPVSKLDVTGRSSYNSITEGWMEHSYQASYAPLDKVRLYGSLQQVNYEDYFFRVTTSALSFQNRSLDPKETVTKLGGGMAYSPVKELTVSGEYRHHDYKLGRDADYYGGRVSLSRPEFLLAGFSVFRMDGGIDTLKYLEYRVFASKSFGKASLALDFIDLNYDTALAASQVKNALSATAAASYRIQPDLLLGADLDYSHNPDFADEVRGMLKATYAFDWTRADEGGAKGEK